MRLSRRWVAPGCRECSHRQSELRMRRAPRAVDVTPDSNLQAHFIVKGPHGNIVAHGDSAAAGIDAYVQTLPINTAGTYKIIVDDLNSTLGIYHLKVYLNAA